MESENAIDVLDTPNTNNYNLRDGLVNVYDKYSPMLFGIALEISPSEIEAEMILISLFQKVNKLDLIQLNKHSICAVLIKLLIQTANEQFKNNLGETKFKLNQFEKTPLVHKMLCEQVTLENHCADNKLTRIQAAKQIREEINLLVRTKGVKLS